MENKESQTRTLAAVASSELLAADAALQKADAQELYDLYRRKMGECDRIGMALETIAKHYVGSKDSPRYMPSDSSIEAMERVALAAIDLAKCVTGKGG